MSKVLTTIRSILQVNTGTVYCLKIENKSDRMRVVFMEYHKT